MGLNYKEELQKAMNLLEKNDYIFIGQCVKYSGTSMYHMIKHIDESRRIELPVFEEVQMGMSAGMTLEGFKICSIYPRMDFLILAINQLVNHLDKVRIMSDNQFNLKGLIIRTCVGSIKPLMPGPQHHQNYYKALKEMCKDIKVIELKKANQIYSAYSEAISSEMPTILIEHSDLYNEDLKQELIESRKQVIR